MTGETINPNDCRNITANARKDISMLKVRVPLTIQDFIFPNWISVSTELLILTLILSRFTLCKRTHDWTHFNDPQRMSNAKNERKSHVNTATTCLLLLMNNLWFRYPTQHDVFDSIIKGFLITVDILISYICSSACFDSCRQRSNISLNELILKSPDLDNNKLTLVNRALMKLKAQGLKFNICPIFHLYYDKIDGLTPSIKKKSDF